MKKFMAIYLGSPATVVSRWDRLSETERVERMVAGRKAWSDWMAKHGASIVERGGPLGSTKRADAKGISDVRNEIAAYVIVQAETHEAAAKMFADHPHFTVFPGEAVEIMECLPIPGTTR
jgi:hypothetical protein